MGNGTMGRILRVDLTEGTIEAQEVPGPPDGRRALSAHRNLGRRQPIDKMTSDYWRRSGWAPETGNRARGR